MYDESKVQLRCWNLLWHSGTVLCLILKIAGTTIVGSIDCAIASIQIYRLTVLPGWSCIALISSDQSVPPQTEGPIFLNGVS